MSTYIHYHSNEMDNWANETLTTEELSQYQSAVNANNLLWQSYQDQGLYTQEDVYKTVYSAKLDTNIEVVIAHKIVMCPGVNLHSLALDANFSTWKHRFLSTNVTSPDLIQIE